MAIERAGWITQHPLKEKPVHVVTREWFEEMRDQAIRADEEVERLRRQLAGAVEALEQARELVAQAYRDDEHDDSPGNMAYAVLNAALTRFGGQ